MHDHSHVLQDGMRLFAGFSNGSIIAYAPKSGKQQHNIHDAHQTAVLSLAVTPDGKLLVSGDSEGYLHIWGLGATSHCLLMSLKEHRVRTSVPMHYHLAWSFSYNTSSLSRRQDLSIRKLRKSQKAPFAELAGNDVQICLSPHVLAGCHQPSSHAQKQSA
jgi:WD40 repeat protein